MSFLSWLRNLSIFHSRLQTANSRRFGSSRKPATRCWLTVETLEDRLVPATFNAASVSDLIADINAANLHGGANTIVLAAHKTLSLTAVDNTTDGATGLPVVASNDRLAIVGNDDTIERSTAAGTPDFRLFDVASGGSLTMKDLTLLNGNGGDSSEGGAILNAGTLTIDHCTLSGNYAFYDGGAIDDSAFAMVVINDCTLSGNSSEEGGAIAADSQSTLTIDHSVLSGNSAVVQGGAIAIGSSCRVTIDHSVLFGNSADGGVGGGISSYGTVTIDQSTLSGNHADGGMGGAIYNAPSATLTVDRGILSGNHADGGLGGAIFIDYQGQSMIVHTEFLGNHANSGVDTYGFGGAIFNQFGTVTIGQSVFAGNVADGGGGSGAQNGGGSIFNEGGTMTIGQSLFVGNTAAHGDGGAIFNGGTLTLDHCTLSDNSAANGGGIYNDDGSLGGLGTLTVEHSIVYGNFAPLGADLYNAGSTILIDSLVWRIDGNGPLTRK